MGPHRDDISFIVNGIDIRKYGSLRAAADSSALFEAGTDPVDERSDERVTDPAA